MKVITLHKFPIKRLHRFLTPYQFLILSAALVGFSAGIAAVALKSAVHYINQLLTFSFNFSFNNLFIPLSPLVGILLTTLVVIYFLKGQDGRGISGILHEIARKSSIVARFKMYSQMIASAITVGLGGSAGLEGPIAVTGAAIGSNFGRVYHVNYKDRTILLAAGSAAGIAAVFNAPITGVMFSIEVLLMGIAITEFIPLIIASACGTLCSVIILDEGILFSFSLTESFNYWNIPFYIILGLFCGPLSLYYAWVSLRIEKLFHRWARPRLVKALLGGLLLSVLCFLFPPLFGEGYESIKSLAQGHPEDVFSGSLPAYFMDTPWVMLLFIGILALVKVLATSLTLSSGGSGGNFAPSLFMGAFVGFFFARLVNMTGIAHLPEGNFTLVGMAGILSGVFYAPLTAIFLIAEVTGGYQLFIPLMIVSSFSFFVSRQVEPYSMDTRRLAKKGEIFTADRDKNVLSLLKTSHILETDIITLLPDSTLGQLVNAIKKSRRNIFAVIDTDDRLLGLITLDDVKELMFDVTKYDTVTVSELMKPARAVIDIHESMQSAMQKFDDTGSWNLPVTDNGKYRGFISKSSILTGYRQQLIKQ